MRDSDESDNIYLVEQDYLHVDAARDILVDGIALNSDGYVTLFDDPLYYWASADVAPTSQSTRLAVGTIRHWRTVPSTTMTFGCPAWVLAEDVAIFIETLKGTQKPQDRELWRRLSSKGRTLMSCIPGAAVHIETTALSPMTNWRSIGGEPVQPPPGDVWDPMASVDLVYVESGVSQSVADRIERTGVAVRRFDLSASPEILEPWWAVVTPEVKEALDARFRARGNALSGVIVVSTEDEYSGRWYSGRDWFLQDLLESRQ